MKKSYGNTWWGQQWLNALANIDFSNRLPRGRTYARKGLVSEISILKNKVSALVQGSRRLPYKVRLEIPTFSTLEVTEILNLISENPLLLSKLLNRRLPEGFKKFCDQNKIALFPNEWADIKGKCSCPDSAIPCKHIAALLYMLANEIDKNPFLLFELHAFDLFQALKEKGFAEEGQKEIAIPSVSSLQRRYTKDRFENEWDHEVYRQLDFSHIPDCKENLLTILTANPSFYPNGDFKKLLRMAFTAISKKQTKQKNETIVYEKPYLYDQVEAIEILLDESMDFVTATFRNSKEEVVVSLDSMRELMHWLGELPLSELMKYSHAVKSLQLLHQFSIRLSQESAYIPQLIKLENDHYKIRWLPAIINSVVKSIRDGVQSILATDILFYNKANEIYEPIESDRTNALISLFLNYFVKQNHALEYQFAEHEIGHLFFNGSVASFPSFENKEYPAAIQLWLNRFYIVEKDFVPILKIDDEGDEGFLVDISIQQKGRGLNAPISLRDVLTKKAYFSMRMEVLRDLSILADYLPQINDLVASKGAEPISFSPDDFVELLFKILPTIRLFGIRVLLPKPLRKLLKPSITMKIGAAKGQGDDSKKGLLNIGKILKFEWQVALGDLLVSQEEFLKLIEQYSGIVKIKDQYLFFDESEIATLIEKLKTPPRVHYQHVLQTALTENYEGAKVTLDKKAKKVMQQLLYGEEVAVPVGLQATLRPYQLSGYKWLYKNYRLGFGSLIADDMGLGKTLQVITILLKLKEEGALKDAKALVIVPTTLLTNWKKEIEKFAPTLSAYVYHGSQRNLKGFEIADVLLTTYGIARTENKRLQKMNWLLIAIDEAQNIKNPNTAQTKAIKNLEATVRIAMSGTPVENRLSEYWSLFDFTNRGYLNSLAKFKEEFSNPIEKDHDQIKLERFRNITQPFILRRLKSDKSIIKDLPDKIEKDQFCQLTSEQIAIYQSVVDHTLQGIAQAKGASRKGLVLKLITTLKQVCNHPWQYLKKGDTSPSLSGKTQMLFDLIHQIQTTGEKTLIFTQYQEMGKLLARLLEDEFEMEVPFLHGGISRQGRDAMVDDFQNNRATRILILSLKAGGTGLNLTAASNVIHYDLWWNPAVEAQATDRAYRIGQQRNVLVHRFITQGTFEEKINQLLQGKKELANLTVATGEKWIGDFSDGELRDLVVLPPP